MWLNTSWRSRTSRKRGYEKPTRVKALAKTQHLPCQAWYEVDPVVVPPTTSKVEHQRVLDKVWRRAGQRLSEADSVYLVGYSWPQADQFFHQLYAVGSVGTQLLKRFCVVNHDQPVHERIRNELLGQQAADRFETLSKPEHRFDNKRSTRSEECSGCRLWWYHCGEHAIRARLASHLLGIGSRPQWSSPKSSIARSSARSARAGWMSSTKRKKGGPQDASP